VVVGWIRRIAAGLDLEQVADAVAVGVGRRRVGDEAVGARNDLLAICDAVGVGVGHLRVRAVDEQLVLAREAVAVGILLGVDGVVWVHAVRQLDVVGDAVAVHVGPGDDDPDRREG